jgi:hypothetical protein
LCRISLELGTSSIQIVRSVMFPGDRLVFVGHPHFFLE